MKELGASKITDRIGKAAPGLGFASFTWERGYKVNFRRTAPSLATREKREKENFNLLQRRAGGEGQKPLSPLCRHFGETLQIVLGLKLL